MLVNHAIRIEQKAYNHTVRALSEQGDHDVEHQIENTQKVDWQFMPVRRRLKSRINLAATTQNRSVRKSLQMRAFIGAIIYLVVLCLFLYSRVEIPWFALIGCLIRLQLLVPLATGKIHVRQSDWHRDLCHAESRAKSKLPTQKIMCNFFTLKRYEQNFSPPIVNVLIS
jgi:hypothetical protein